MKIFVVYKKSVYQKYVLDDNNARLKKLIRLNDVSTKNLLFNHRKHLRAIDAVEKILKSFGVQYNMSNRTVIPSFKGYDLVVTIGGDGTFLRVAHSIKDQILIGINSVPETSVGAYCPTTISKFKDKILGVLSGRCKIKNLMRVDAMVNGTLLPTKSVNDILYTNISPAATSRYIIGYKKIHEEHKSSGLWIATPSGSSAAIHAAGGHKQKHSDGALQFLVREPYQGIFHPYKITHGFVTKKTPLKVISKMIKSRLYFDGPTTSYGIEYGDHIVLRPAKKPLKTVV